MKKFLFCTAFFISTVAFANTYNAPGNVEKAFSESFPTATEIKWYQEGNHSVVRFVKDKITSELTYDANASIVKTIRYYLEDNLPPMVMCKVMAKYPGKKIYGVTEIYGEQQVEYHIVLQDDTKWYNVASDAFGNCTLKSKFRKA